MSKQAELNVASRATIMGGLFSLLVVGLITWLRMIKRDISTDRFKGQLDTIRETFVKHCDDIGALATYDLFPHSVWGGARKFGGLTDTVAVLNGFLAGGIVAAWMLPDPSELSEFSPLYLPVVYSALIGFSAFAAQRFYAVMVRRDLKEPTHGGGVVYRDGKDGPEYLLISPKDRSNKWVLPKGHIKSNLGEKPPDAAVREVWEETEVVAEVKSFVARVRFRNGIESQDIAFYLMKRLDVAGPPPSIKTCPKREKEQREKAWYRLEAACEKLSYKESKLVLCQAHLELQNLLNK